MQIILNENHLLLSDIEEYASKARAILVDDDNKIIVANYNGALLLPGGSLDKNETPIEALIRELKEETGCNYTESELEYFSCLSQFQKQFPKTNGSIKNRLIDNYYFIGKSKGLSLNNQKLTISEQKDNFKISLLTIEEIFALLNEKTLNPRSKFFNAELNEILQLYKNTNDFARIKK